MIESLKRTFCKEQKLSILKEIAEKGVNFTLEKHGNMFEGEFEGDEQKTRNDLLEYYK